MWETKKSNVESLLQNGLTNSFFLEFLVYNFFTGGSII